MNQQQRLMTKPISLDYAFISIHHFRSDDLHKAVALPDVQETLQG